jgi:hypothetical protein
MDHQIVHALIDAWLKESRRRPYRDLVLLMGDTPTQEVTGRRWKGLQPEVQAFWNMQEGRRRPRYRFWG